MIVSYTSSTENGQKLAAISLDNDFNDLVFPVDQRIAETGRDQALQLPNIMNGHALSLCCSQHRTHTLYEVSCLFKLRPKSSRRRIDTRHVFP